MSFIIRNIVKAFIIFTAVIVMAAPAGSKDFQYDPRGKRDPFVPLVGAEKPAVTRLEDVTSVDDLNLEGIAVVGGGRASAIINGQIVKADEKVGEIEIKSITKSGVTLLVSGKEYTIKLPEQGGAKSE